MKDLKELEASLTRAFRNQVIIALSLLGSMAVLVIIEEFIRHAYRPFYGYGKIAFGQLATFRYIIYAISVASLILMRLLQSIFTRLSPDIDFYQGLQRLITGSLVPLCLAEVPAILGFVFFLLTGLSRDFYVLTIVSVILLFMYFPRKSFWQEKLGRFFS
jgi:hypothetical protein